MRTRSTGPSPDSRSASTHAAVSSRTTVSTTNGPTSRCRLPPRPDPRCVYTRAMDLHVIGPLASPAERAAVDAVLGPAESAWRGGERNPMVEGHSARGGHEARSRRDLLIPALHAVQSRVGWISQPALNYISRRLTVPPAEAYGVATFCALFATTPRPPTVAHVCDDIACRLAGAEALCGDLTRAVGPAGEPARDGRVTWLRSPCLGLCDRAPAVLFTFAGESPATVAHAPVDAVGVVTMLEADQAPGRYTFRDPPPA